MALYIPTLTGSSRYGIARCGEGTTNDTCETAQNFCKTNQLASHWVNTSLGTITANDTKILASTWNKIRTILTNIQNYGARNHNAEGLKQARHPFVNTTETETVTQTSGGTTLPGWCDSVTWGGTIEGVFNYTPVSYTTVTTYYPGVLSSTAAVANATYVDDAMYNNIIKTLELSTSNNVAAGTKITKALMDVVQTRMNNFQLDVYRCNSCNTSCNTSCQASFQYGGGCGEGFDGGGYYSGCPCSTYDCQSSYIPDSNGYSSNTGYVNYGCGGKNM